MSARPPDEARRPPEAAIDRGPVVDPRTVLCLGDGWHAAECITADGERKLWLISPNDGAAHGCACRACAPHEQTAGLPRWVRDRLGMRCGADTRQGHPCRASVSRPGGRCWQHQETTP
jgi:hypothetical protein